MINDIIPIKDSIDKITIHSFHNYAKIYIQDSGLPLILTMTINGKYKKAMKSEQDMHKLVDVLAYLNDQSSNMDW